MVNAEPMNKSGLGGLAHRPDGRLNCQSRGMQTWNFYLWTIAHVVIAVAVALTAPMWTALAVLALIACSQISVYFNAKLDEGVFEETTIDGAANLLRSAYLVGPLAILALTGVVLFLFIQPI